MELMGRRRASATDRDKTTGRCERSAGTNGHRVVAPAHLLKPALLSVIQAAGPGCGVAHPLPPPEALRCPRGLSAGASRCCRRGGLQFRLVRRYRAQPRRPNHRSVRSHPCRSRVQGTALDPPVREPDHSSPRPPPAARRAALVGVANHGFSALFRRPAVLRALRGESPDRARAHWTFDKPRGVDRRGSGEAIMARPQPGGRVVPADTRGRLGRTRLTVRGSPRRSDDVRLDRSAASRWTSWSAGGCSPVAAGGGRRPVALRVTGCLGRDDGNRG
jgi:hypothetical protein